MRIEDHALDDPRVVELLQAHHAELRAGSPPESCHVLDLTGLRAPGVTVFAAYDDAPAGELLGCLALAVLTPEHAELKSMRTVAGRLRQGVASRLLVHVLDRAREAGARRVSLETGAWEAFAPARALYARHGFVECEAFGAYSPDPGSTFMTRLLAPASSA